MWFAFLIAVAWGHPFDITFYGHDMTLRLGQGEVNVQYTLEIPVKILSDQLKEFWAEEALSKQQLRERFIAHQYELIESELDLLIDEQFVPWETVVFKEVTTTDQGRFTSFDVNFSVPFPNQMTSITLVNGNVLGQRSIFRNRILVDNSVAVYNSDMIVWKNDQIDGVLLGHWNLEETLREIRLRVDVEPKIMLFLKDNWDAWVYETQPMYSLEEAVVKRSWVANWKKGKTTLRNYGVVLLIVGCLCFISTKRSSKGVAFSTVVLLLLSSFGDIPWLWFAYPTVLGFLLLLIGVYFGLVQNWPLLLVALASLWLQPPFLGIPLLLLLHLMSPVGWVGGKKIATAIILLFLLYFTLIIVFYL